MTEAPTNPPNQLTSNFAAFMAGMGMVSSLVFSAIGSAYGMAKAGVAVTSIGIMHPDKLMKSLIPVIMAGMIGIYGVLIAIVLTTTKRMQLFFVLVHHWF
jgi:ATP synthase proteolipid subunit